MPADEKSTLYYNKEQKTHVSQDVSGNISATFGNNTVKIDRNGNSFVNIPVIRSFTIKNHIHLREYSLEREDGVTTHRFVFLDGGNGILSYDAAGKTKIFELRDCQSIINHDGDITVGQQDKKPDSQSTQ